MQSFRRLAEFPIYPWLLAVFTPLQLAAFNILQVDIREVGRPLVFSVMLATVGYLMLFLIFRRAQPAAFVLFLGLIFFFTYGHVYQLLRESGLSFGRHRYLIPAYSLMVAGAIWIAVRRGSRLSPVAIPLNALTLALLVLHTVQITNHFIQVTRIARRATAGAIEAVGPQREFADQDLPDIYYIILDTYTRSDALQRDYGYDNSWFLDGLRALGFYVADCARSNYGETLTSLTSALNLNYISAIRGRLTELGLDPKNVFVLLKQSVVRERLESLGYKTVAFQTGFEWSDLQEADIYLALSEQPLDLQRLSPFEVLFVETTAAKLLVDAQYLLKIADFGAADFKYRTHVELQLNILEELPRVPSIEGPTFTFAHVLIPHVPMVFEPGGKIVSDPGFYSGPSASPIDHDHFVRGYTNGVAFVSHRMQEIARTLVGQSKTPPVIIIQGDTGVERDNRMQILDAYYAPLAQDDLYPTITPVNSFRTIFNDYLGTGYDRLPDFSYPQDDTRPAELETAPSCVGG